MSLTIDHKRGNTLESACVYRDENGDPTTLEGITIASQIRTDRGALVSDCDVFITTPEMGLFTLTVADTTGWPVGRLEWDIRYSFGSTVISTETVYINVLKEVTRP